MLTILSQLPLATLDAPDACLITAAIAAAITAAAFMELRSRERAQWSDMIEREYWSGRRQGEIDGRREGREEASEMALKEIASRPWQTVAPVHRITSDATRKPSEN